MFEVIRVDQANAVAVEQLGTKRKFWYRAEGRLLLFKAEERGTGEDWAEKLACELSELMGLPHVHYELAFDNATRHPGVVCESCSPEPLALAHGNQLLLAVDSSYPADVAARYKVREHTIDAVVEVLRRLDKPRPEWSRAVPSDAGSALGVFIGYVLLDAWIANQDRHHQNWGAIWDGQALALAPTFDHGGALARNLTDDERRDRLATRDRNRTIDAFARRARSAFYDEPSRTRPMTTTDAWLAFAARDTLAARAWLDRLRRIDMHDVETMIARIPDHRMSPVCREFTLYLLQANRTRLLSEEALG